MVLEETQIRAGKWEGILTGFEGVNPPSLVAYCGDRKIGDPSLLPHENGVWVVQLEIPAETINTGTQTYVIEDPQHGILASFQVTSGTSADDDIASEVRLLRAELDMLKRAFRRQSRHE